MSKPGLGRNQRYPCPIARNISRDTRIKVVTRPSARGRCRAEFRENQVCWPEGTVVLTERCVDSLVSKSDEVGAPVAVDVRNLTRVMILAVPASRGIACAEQSRRQIQASKLSTTRG
jgi:hypothetical protein